MKAFKTITLAVALVAGSMSFAVAQNGPVTGGEPPVAGGAGGNPTNNGMMTSPKQGGAMSAPAGQTPTNTPASNHSGKKQDK